MKFVKIIIGLLLALVVAIVIANLAAPKEVTLSRSLEMPVAVDFIFPLVNNVQNWEKWGPWKESDPNMTFTYGEQVEGVGASYSWVSKSEGNGKLTIEESSLNNSIKTKLEFEGKGPGNGSWTFEPIENGTKVTWGMKTNMAEGPFMFRFFGFFMEKMAGPMFEKGLSNLSNVAAVSQASFMEEMAQQKALEEQVLQTIDSLITD